MIKYYSNTLNGKKQAHKAAKRCHGRVFFQHKVKGYYVKKPKNCFFLKI